MYKKFRLFPGVTVSQITYLYSKYYIEMEGNSEEPTPVDFNPALNHGVKNVVHLHSHRKSFRYLVQSILYTIKERFWMRARLKKENLSFEKLMELGLLVIDRKDDQLYLLDENVIEALSERGIEPRDFHAYEKIGVLKFHPSPKGAVVGVSIQKEVVQTGLKLSKEGIENVVQACHRDDPFDNQVFGGMVTQLLEEKLAH